MKPYTSSRSWVLLLVLTALTPACSRWEGEVVESQYQAPLVPDPTYTFQRQGTSSVDLLLPQQAASASDKGGKTKCYVTTELKTHCKSLCVRAFGRFAR